MKSLRGLIPYVMRYRGLVVAGSVFLLLSNAVTLTAPWVSKMVIDGLTAKISPMRLGQFAVWIVGIAVVGGVFATSCARC